MSSFSQLFRFSNYVIGNYKTVVQGRINWLNPVQLCNYTRKSAEEKLGLDKPKRPLTPYFKFMAQMRPALLSKNPGITSKEAIAWTSKHWHQLDVETKSQLAKEYEKDLEDYKKIKALYEASLTEDQKENIKKVKEEMNTAREKKKLKAVYKELGRPKKPMTSYFLYVKSRNDTFKPGELKEYHDKVKIDWQKLPKSEKEKFEKQADELMRKYKKDLEAWELKMISMGRLELVRTKQAREKKPKIAEKKQQGLGCSDDSTDSIDIETRYKGTFVQSIIKDNYTSVPQDSRELHQKEGKQNKFIQNRRKLVNSEINTNKDARVNANLYSNELEIPKKDESVESQNTGEIDEQKSKSHPVSSENTQNQNRSIFSSIKSFFRRQMLICHFIVQILQCRVTF